MRKIKNVLLCGLGGIGCLLAVEITDSSCGNLKILVDKERYERYTKTGTFFNSKPYNFKFILPETKFKADLVIIATKNDGLDFAIDNIKNKIHKNTVFISLLNGINSENKIAEKYGSDNVVTSFYLGHSCIREGRNIYQDGVYEIVIGIKEKVQEDALALLCSYFFNANIKFRVSNDITSEYWKKFMINVGINQLSAVTDMSLKEIKQNPSLVQKLKNLIMEVEIIAEKEGISAHKQIADAALKFLLEDIEDVEPSMLQDIRAGRKTEVDIFSGEVIRLAEKHKIKAPMNEEIYKQIKGIEKHA